MKEILNRITKWDWLMTLCLAVQYGLTIISINTDNTTIQFGTLILQIILLMPSFMVAYKWIESLVEKEDKSQRRALQELVDHCNKKQTSKELDQLEKSYFEQGGDSLKKEIAKEFNSLNDTENKFHQERDRLEKEINDLYK